jgi:hypothetical protein
VKRLALGCIAFVWAILFFAISAHTQVNVLTYHFNNSWTGGHLGETNLTPANVNSGPSIPA